MVVFPRPLSRSWDRPAPRLRMEQRCRETGGEAQQASAFPGGYGVHRIARPLLDASGDRL